MTVYQPPEPLLHSEFQFHHIGYASYSLEKELEFFKHLGYSKNGLNFTDHEQGILGCFLEGPGPRLELLENLPDRNTLTPWLNKGINIYHIAYQVVDLAKAISWASNKRGRMLVKPVPASAFDGRRICFFAFRNGPLLEFIEL